MVRDYAQNVDVILGEDGLLAAGSKGKTIIVMSTLDPGSMNDLGRKVEKESDFQLVSAAVSGGHSGAEAGTLSIMTSGAQTIVESCRPYFDAMGSNVFFYGEKPGNSQVAKLINNMILGININAVAEGLKLGSHYQLPPEALFNLLKVSTGDSWVARNWGDVSEWTADTALAVLLRDLKAAYSEGLKYGVALPFNALSSVCLFNSMGKTQTGIEQQARKP